MELSPSWEAANCAATKKVRRFITSSQERSTSPYPEPDRSSPYHPISLRSILILSTYLRLGLPSGLFPSGVPTNILYAFLFAHIRATCPAHLILLYFFLICIVGGWSPNWVPSARRPLTGLLYLPRVMENGEFGGMNCRGNRSTRRKPAPAPLCPPQISLDQTRDWTRAAAVGRQRLTASAMARPFSLTWSF
jgi:hypothetical protein